ncbi:MAG: hypothetical protein ACI4LO_05000 [Anaerovoracaceae bacterium]
MCYFSFSRHGWFNVYLVSIIPNFILSVGFIEAVRSSNRIICNWKLLNYIGFYTLKEYNVIKEKGDDDMFDRDDASREEMREIIGEFSVKKRPEKGRGANRKFEEQERESWV